MLTAERWRVEDLHEAIWLVRLSPWGDSRALQARAETLAPAAAIGRLSAWFPANWGSSDRLLAEICLSLQGAFPASGVPDSDWLHETVRRALLDGRLIAFRLAFSAPVEGFAPEEEEPPAPQREARESIRIVVVEDKTWKPIPSIKLKVTIPDGVEHLGTTGSDGSIEHWNIARGACDLTSEIDGAVFANSFEVVALDHGEPPPPVDEEPIKGAEGRRFAVGIQRHKVTRRDSLDSVARSFGLTRQQLAGFNFLNSDQPGIICIPVPWSVKGLATGQTHTVRVKRKSREFAFSV